MVISQYYHQFNKSVLRLTLQSRRFFQPEVDSKHSESEWNQDSGHLLLIVIITFRSWHVGKIHVQTECFMWSLSELYKPFHTCNRCNNFDWVQQFRGCSNYVEQLEHFSQTHMWNNTQKKLHVAWINKRVNIIIHYGHEWHDIQLLIVNCDIYGTDINRCNNFDWVQQFRGCSNYVGNGP
jgi:hypothetical protein